METKGTLKRVIAALLVSCMIFGMVPVAGAEPMPSVKAEASSEEGQAGSTVSVSVYMEPGNGMYDDAFWSYTLQIGYDPNVLSIADTDIVDQAEAESFEAHVDEDGNIAVEASNFGDMGFIFEKQKVMTIDFKINPEAVTGMTDVVIDSGTFTNDENPVTIYQLVPGTVAVTNDPPSAADVSIDGAATIGSQLTGSYTYADPENNPEGLSAFQWYAADNVQGTGKSAIDGAASSVFTPGDEQLGQYLFFGVTPIAAAGTITGAETLSPPVGPVTVVVNTAAVTIGEVSGRAGATVDVPVTLTEASAGVGSFGMRIGFDADALQVTGVSGQVGDHFASHYDNNAGWLQVAWADASGGDQPAVQGQQLFQITFAISPSASLGEKSLTVATDDPLQFTMTDIEAEELTKTLHPGSITVRDKNSGGSGPSDPTDPTDPSKPSGPAETTKPSVDVLVNGKAESAGTAEVSQRNGQSVLTIALDEKKLEDKLASEGQGAVVTIPVSDRFDVVAGELNGQMVKNMEEKQAVLEIRTDFAIYTLPARQINIEALSREIGASVSLQDIKVQIEIAAPTADTVKLVENAADQGGFSLVVPAQNFTVRGIYGDTSIEVSRFNAYVERMIVIPAGVDPVQITTGVVIEPDGTVRHVPTKIIVVDGKYYAKVNSLTNSTYAVIWHPLAYADVIKHWAEEAVNDMGSRMIVNGVGAGSFEPDRDITRAEFAAIMVRGLGLKPEAGVIPFGDVHATDWYHTAVYTAYTSQLINGFEDGTFRPNDKITREQAMAIIAKAMQITGLKDKLTFGAAEETLRPYSDADKIAGWALNGIADSIQANIVTGRSATGLAPKAYMTRAEVAAIMQRLLQTSELI